MMDDPSTNVLLDEGEDFRGQGFLGLLRLGLTEEALAIMLEMVNMTSLMEAYSQNKLINPHNEVLASRSNGIQHRLLSLPSGTELEESSGVPHGLYECCRLAALLYAIAALFVLPPSTGCPQRLVLGIKSALEDVRFKDLYGAGAKFYIWVLMLAGIAAERMPERSWFAGHLQGLITLEGISCWTELKDIVLSFLWMSSVCDEGGMNLWEDVAGSLRSPASC
jgi:hypothetical protein